MLTLHHNYPPVLWGAFLYLGFRNLERYIIFTEDRLGYIYLVLSQHLILLGFDASQMTFSSFMRSQYFFFSFLCLGFPKKKGAASHHVESSIVLFLKSGFNSLINNEVNFVFLWIKYDFKRRNNLSSRFIWHCNFSKFIFILRAIDIEETDINS